MARAFFDRSAGKLRFSSESEIAEEISVRNVVPSVIVGPRGRDGLQGERGGKGILGVGEVGDKGIQGASIPGDKGVQGESIPGDKGVQGESIPGDKGPVGDKGPTGPAGTSSGAVLAPFRSAAIGLTTNFAGSVAKVTYTNLIHDDGGFFDPANPGVLKIPADYGSKAWVQPSYCFDSGATTGQRIANLIQVVNGTETVLTGYTNILPSGGLKGVSFRGSFLLVDPGTEFYVAYTSGTAARAMLAGAWFQIEVRKQV